ncbi:hypothetical protein MKK64_12090 [Methylobacterium sp. E-025]|nr:hypothetical protein [Methylobacterium sp. E-025]
MPTISRAQLHGLSGDRGGQGYRLLVSLHRAQVRAEGADIALRLGMPAQVDIATSQHWAIAFLLNPIENHVEEAGHVGKTL